ncbi:MAG: hypothetical protein ACRD1T_02840 [Acidimicrobiia bacterium]
MRILGVSAVQLIASAAIVAFIAALVLTVTTVLGVSPIGNDSPPAQGGTEAAPAVPRPLDQVTVCVDTVNTDPGVRSLAELQVESAMQSVTQHPYWVPAGFSAKPVIVDMGCPSQPLPITSGIPFRNGYPRPYGLGSISEATLAPLPRVATASYYRLFVFVLPAAEDIDRLLGGAERRVASQEFVCQQPLGHPCAEATLAAYVTADEMQTDSALLVHLLTQGVGFASR